MLSVRALLQTFRSPFASTKLRRLKRDENGGSAIEFAVVSTPFLMFVMGMIGISLYFFVINSIEKGMDQTSRLIRTGEAVKDKMTVGQFKNSICKGAGDWVRCNNLQIFTNHYPGGWAQLKQAMADPTSVPTPPPPACVVNGQPNTNIAADSDLIAIYSGTASDVVVVTGCYKWEFTEHFPFLKLGNLSGGAMMVETSTAFRSEPYPNS